MSIATEIVQLERKYEDLEQNRALALNERTGRADQISAEMREVQARIDALKPFAESPAPGRGGMRGCSGCGKSFWPESLSDGRCEFCGPLGGEKPSESIQNGDLKRRRTSKS